jgi:glycosyltransferase involved in cell wall biosynthesis
MDRKIKVMAIVPNKSGVGYFRSIKPHIYLEEFHSDKFEVTMVEQFDFSDPDFGKDQDIIHFHVNVGPSYDNWFNKIKELQSAGVKLLMDLDDWYVLEKFNYYYNHYKNGITDLIKRNIRTVDYVTTTTPIFAKELLKLNKNVIVLPNSIDRREKQFQPSTSNSERLKIALICGSSHEKDIDLLKGVVNMLKPELHRLQFVLCGFDLGGQTTNIDPKTGQRTTRDITPQESVWSRYEEVITDNYSIISPEYKNYLMSYNSTFDYPNVENEPYKRRWTLPTNKYAEHFVDCDVLLVPLVNSEFNCMKSQLKVCEAAFTNKNIIASNVGPYKLDLRSAYKKGGEIDLTANSLLVEPTQGAKDWVKYIKLLLNNPELRETLKTNLNKEIVEKYELGVTTQKRADFYEKLIIK